eukprot:16439891-Heterocapsa_arctica.AAC.1
MSSKCALGRQIAVHVYNLPRRATHGTKHVKKQPLRTETHAENSTRGSCDKVPDKMPEDKRLIIQSKVVLGRRNTSTKKDNVPRDL